MPKNLGYRGYGAARTPGSQDYGLQDEKLSPGKIYSAKTGKLITKGYTKGSEHPLAGRQGNVLHKLKSQKELKKITDSDKYKKADYKDKTEMLGGKVYTRAEMENK